MRNGNLKTIKYSSSSGTYHRNNFQQIMRLIIFESLSNSNKTFRPLKFALEKVNCTSKEMVIRVNVLSVLEEDNYTENETNTYF